LSREPRNVNDSTSLDGVVHLIKPPSEYWGASDTTYGGGRTSPREAPGSERSERPARERNSLDRCTYVAPKELPNDQGGEWHVQLTQVGDYGEFIAVEDSDGSLLRHFRKHSTPSTASSTSVDSRSQDDIDAHRLEKLMAAGRRAKRNCKWKVRMLGADRLWTLTTRGGIKSRPEAWELWGQFERYCSRRFPKFKCVVVMERHQGGGANDQCWHIHFCTNRFFPVDSMRLWWHRILTGRALQGPMRGADSPGNIDVSRVLGGGKLSGYLAKYLTKSLIDEMGEPSTRVKRFASSKGIGEPAKSRSRMAARCGEHVYRLRVLAESCGFRVEGIFEGTVAGRSLVWMKCKAVRAAARSPEGSSIPLTGALANGAGAAYS
jgi:hypothetical protein